ncbi:TrkH family potassium uptake protein [Haliangium ochraceum]|uniref:H(+)-transporting two-sector ATPase n=1 Tax=Haliangium ochraceum (strain DSM 14365 / JCM 11303 / SMP-2) TaxID=502025 RepID=D0LJG6_HALO1|nr:potassium transporter TrkG [Haliangium ochraceum]ACY16540.1 H(+)-transporting two-sector ATPase [Haliangium ochraceum DSM 14365]
MASSPDSGHSDALPAPPRAERPRAAATTLHVAALSGALAAAAPAPVAVASWLRVEISWPAVPTLAILSLVATLCLGLSSVVVRRRARPGRWLGALGIVLGTAGAADLLLASPVLALIMLVGATAAVNRLWAPEPMMRRLIHLAHPSVATARARGAAMAAVAVWLVVALRGLSPQPVGQAVLAVSLLAALGIIAGWLRREYRRYRWRAWIFIATAGCAAAAVAAAALAGSARVDALMLVPGAACLLLPMVTRPGLGRMDWWEPILGHPARFLVVSFAGLCVLGTVLLALPVALEADVPGVLPGAGLPLVDAAFTAVSAVCVTGLGVVDTPHTFGRLGELILLVLIQLGGLGIMAFSTAALGLLGRRMSLRYEGMVASLMSAQDRNRLHGATRQLIGFTLLTEAVGALVLALLFWQQGDDVASALWRGLFTSVSAFCNAGFSLQSDSLIPYQAAPAILHVIALLIIAGALSPAAALAVPELVRRRKARVSAQIKLALVTTAALLFGGALLMLTMEWDASLAGMSALDRVHNAWFHSVTLRTAGFNSTDLATTRPETFTVMLVWMFIGGNPGGTAGGAKTVTAALMILAVVAAIRGRAQAHAFGRRISHASVYRAAAIVTVGVLSVLGAVIALELTQAAELTPRMAIFEVVSALATVGLSIGGTALLDEVGKVVIIACMFMGRVGPLTMFMFLQSRSAEDHWQRPEEEINVG